MYYLVALTDIIGYKTREKEINGKVYNVLHTYATKDDVSAFLGSARGFNIEREQNLTGKDTYNETKVTYRFVIKNLISGKNMIPIESCDKSFVRFCANNYVSEKDANGNNTTYCDNDSIIVGDEEISVVPHVEYVKTLRPIQLIDSKGRVVDMRLFNVTTSVIKSVKSFGGRQGRTHNPGYGSTENNWKQAKVRKQYMWHKGRLDKSDVRRYKYCDEFFAEEEYDFEETDEFFDEEYYFDEETA